jgi:hypothetical protein
MYHEIKFDFQTAARKRAAGDQIRSAYSLGAKYQPQASTLFITRTAWRRPIAAMARLSRQIRHEPRAMDF